MMRTLLRYRLLKLQFFFLQDLKKKKKKEAFLHSGRYWPKWTGIWIEMERGVSRSCLLIGTKNSAQT